MGPASMRMKAKSPPNGPDWPGRGLEHPGEDLSPLSSSMEATAVGLGVGVGRTVVTVGRSVGVGAGTGVGVDGTCAWVGVEVEAGVGEGFMGGGVGEAPGAGV